jgi:NitT/TauT family transport system substrate-binding protein
VIRYRTLAATLAALMLLPAAAMAQTPNKVRIGVTRSVVASSALLAQQNGYFKEAGLDVDIEFIDASASAVALLAANQFQAIDGGISASFFNGVAQGLPVKLALDVASTPTGHTVMVRTALKDKIKSVADLKGHPIAINAPNTITQYEMERVLKSGGLTLKDVDVKILPFQQIPIAFTTGAVDAAIMILPWTFTMPEQGMAVPFLDVDKIINPLQVAATMYNTDWATKNPEVAQSFFTAYLRGIRDYCTAYHRGGNRPEVLKLLVDNKLIPNAQFLADKPWNSRNPNGDLKTASILDVQKWYVDQKLVPAAQPLDKLVDEHFADNAVKKLGAFKVPASSDRADGCGK